MFYDADKPMPPAGWSEMMEFELKKCESLATYAFVYDCQKLLLLFLLLFGASLYGYLLWIHYAQYSSVSVIFPAAIISSFAHTHTHTHTHTSWDPNLLRLVLSLLW